MAWTISNRPRADQDIEEAARWYEEQRTGYGDLFLDEVSRSLDAIASNPEHFPLYFGDLRRALVRRFPYKIFFGLDGERVIVLRVLHTARDHTSAIFD